MLNLVVNLRGRAGRHAERWRTRPCGRPSASTRGPRASPWEARREHRSSVCDAIREAV